MIKLENIKIGAKVRRVYNSKDMTYTITDVNAHAAINGQNSHCICYKPDYETVYTRFVRDINDFMTIFELVKIN